jgi:predicted NBD/HSP70 family sugar kinase
MSVNSKDKPQAYLVFDVGGTFTKYAIMMGEGEIVLKDKYPTVIRGDEASEEGFTSGIEKLYRMYQDDYDIMGIAISMPGQIDVEQGKVYGGGALNFLDEKVIGPVISKRCDGVRVAMENDGKCAALAEVWKGNASTAKDACVLIMGTGIGGGIIIDRKVHRGKRMLAGEISYALQDMKLSQLDDVVLAENLQRYEEAFGDMPFLSTSQCSVAGMCYKAAKLYGVPFSEMSGELLYKKLDEGDERAKELLEETYFNIAKLCVNLYVTIDPDVILIGGGISAEPRFVEGIKRYVERLKGIAKLMSGLRIDTCRFRNDSNLLGALYNFKQIYDE